MEKEKKRKLTISISDKTKSKSVGFKPSFGKKAFVVEKRSFRKKFTAGSSLASSSKKFSEFKKPIQPKPYRKEGAFHKKFEIRKIAEERATKRISGNESKAKLSNKSKIQSQKREYKLTLSRALNEEDSIGKERSLASIRRARLKEKKNLKQNKEDLKKVVRDVDIPKTITIQELSNRMAEQASGLIKHLLKMGVTATINHSIDGDTAEYLVKEFGHNPIRQVDINLKYTKDKKIDLENLEARPPIVTVMGHVDHGKTSILDALRKTDVVSSEHGGITQHIGAYQVKDSKNNLITFLDTPGHAAFTEMRARGSKITDIVVLVVAADDGVKPQTVEAINHSKAAKVPIIVAINKCDLPGADPQKIKNQLLEYELIAEELSGETLITEVSAKTKKGLENLKDQINLQADLLELKANNKVDAKGVVIESKVDKGRGPVSTVLIIDGTLKVGDFFVSGSTLGKVRAMIDYNGQNLKTATPSTPVEILGFNQSPKSGDDFVVVENESKGKEINSFRVNQDINIQNPNILTSQEGIFEKKEEIKEMPIILKSDVHGSSEAIKNAIMKIENKEVKPKIISDGLGLISEADITLAKATNSIVIGFNVKPSKEAKKLAENLKINIKFFNIIYEALDFVTLSLSGLLKPSFTETVLGSAEILEIFKVSKIGRVAGSKVVDGEILINSNARLIRDGTVMYTGSINSIFREKNAAKKVSAGLECGITLKDFADFKEKDIIEAYKLVENERRI